MATLTSDNKKLLTVLEELGIRTDKTYEVNIHIKVGEVVTVETKSYLYDEKIGQLEEIAKNYKVVEKNID